MKTNGIKMQRAPDISHLNKYVVKEHCLYCDKALYKMSFNPHNHTIGVVDDPSRVYNSDNQRICEKCDTRLIRKGTPIECSSCDQPIYAIVLDKFKEDSLKLEDLTGVAPQHDPIEGVVNRCVHCKSIIEWG